MKIEKMIIDKILEWNFVPGERKRSSLNKQVKHLKETLYKPENYLSYNVHNGELTKLVFAEFSDTPFELDRINVNCFYFKDATISKKNICNELINLRDHFAPKKLKIVIGGREGQDRLYRLLKRLGFDTNGVKLVGDVVGSYEKIQRLSIPMADEDFAIEEFKFDRDIEKVMALELRAHRAEPSSVVHKLPKKHWSFFRDFLKQLSKARTAYILKCKGKIIGFVGYNIREEIPSGAFVSSISIDPKFKGQGLSKLMYMKMLSEMKSRRIKQFYGYSKTDQVLRFSKKIGRKPCFYSFKLDKNKLQSL